jgi:hypothetical protein
MAPSTRCARERRPPITESRPNANPPVTNLGRRSLTLRESNRAQLQVNMSRPSRPAPLLFAAALAMAGCATHDVKPSIEAPQRFAAAPVSAPEPEVAWWAGYGDPVLANLMQRAARENRDVKIAAARVRAARAGETISRSFLMPSIGVSAFGLDHRDQYTDLAKAQVPDATVVAGGLDVSWEVNISGRLRAAADAASADTLAAQDAARAVRLLVLSASVRARSTSNCVASPTR